MSGTPTTDHRHELCTERHPARSHGDAWRDPHCVVCGEPMSVPAAAPAPARDPLWPNGDRPMCRQPDCRRLVYLAGLCGQHWVEQPYPADYRPD